MTKSMRDAFLDELYDIAREDRRVVLLSNDFGAPSLDKFREDCASQFIHIGIAEQNMVNLAAGLAMAGKIPYMYSIAPFLPLRCYEQLRVHLGLRGLHITGVGVGAGYAYDLSGPTHHTLEDIAMMNALPGMTVFSASDSIMGGALARLTYGQPAPYYIRFDRQVFPLLYDGEKEDFSEGLAVLKQGHDLAIVATGIMVHQALKVANELARHSIDASVVDLYRIKPLNRGSLMKAVIPSRRVLTLEENFTDGGIGSIVSTMITDQGEAIKLKRIGIPNQYYSQGGGREALHRLCGLDVDSIVNKTLSWMKEE